RPGDAEGVADRVADGVAGHVPAAIASHEPAAMAGHVPAAIALSPILSARYRPQDLQRIEAAAPGARLVMVSRDGHADGSVEAVAELAVGFGCRVVATRRHGESRHGESRQGESRQGESRQGESLHGESRLASGIEVVGGPEALPGLLGRSDFIVLAAPLTPETENLIDESSLAAVKPGAWLINVARGRLIDERALLRALRDGPLGGAIL